MNIIEKLKQTPKPQEKIQSIEVKSYPQLVAKYSLFKEKLKPKADIVYHPCNANDVSPSFAFPDSRVIYVDINQKYVEALKNGGFEAHAASALEFEPGDVDILIMLNPQISPEVPSSHVVENGFVLCNDYHGTASFLHNNEQYQLRSIIKLSRNGELILETENLDECWTDVDSDEEFKNAPFSWGKADYKTATIIVEAVTGRKENILAEYKKIIAQAREEERQKNAKRLQEHPEWADFIEDPDKSDALAFNYGEKNFVLPTILPKKKGATDDIFIFQKKASKKE